MHSPLQNTEHITIYLRDTPLDQQSVAAHREALLYGQSFVTVWADPAGNPLVTVETAHQMAVIVDPGTRVVTAAIKRWRTKTTTEAVVYLPEEIVRLRADSPGAATAGFYVVDTLPNPLGVVPVVPLDNRDLIGVVHVVNGEYLSDTGCQSEIADLCPLVDALNKILTDMMVTSEYVGQPRRWVTGLQLKERPVLDADGFPVLDDDGYPVTETVSPIPEGDRLMHAEPTDAKFGQLDSAGLGGYRTAVDVLMQQIMAVSALPAHMVGVTTANPASADANRSAEASLTARAEARQQSFGRGWEQVARLMVAVRDGVDPATVHPRIRWADASTRSIAAEADATVKLYQSGLLPTRFALAKLGYSADEIAAIEAERAATQPTTTPQIDAQGTTNE